MERWLFRFIQSLATKHFEYIVVNFIYHRRQHSLTEFPAINFNDS